MKGCRTIAEFAIKKWMEDSGFVMNLFSVEMDENVGIITDNVGAKMTVEYNPKIKTVTVKEEKK